MTGQVTTIRKLLLNLCKDETTDVFHSVHNTNRKEVITLLYYKSQERKAMEILQNVHEELEAKVNPKSRKRLSAPGTRIEITGKQNQADSSQAKIYATYADAYLENPQGGEEEEDENEGLPSLNRQDKRKSSPQLSYSTVASKPMKQAQATSKITGSKSKEGKKSTRNSDDHLRMYDGDTSSTDISDASSENQKWLTMEERFQERMDKMEEHFETQYGKVEGITIEEADVKIAESISRVHEQSQAFLEQRFQEFTVDIMDKIRKENQTLKDDMVESQEKMFDRFVALQNKQNSRMLSTTESYEKQFDQLFNEIAQLKTSLNHTEVAARPSNRSSVSGEGK